MAFIRLPTEAHQYYVALKSALTERFEPTSKQEVFKAEFESHRKSNAESWGDFGDELLRLVDKAFPTLEYKAKEQFALSRYLDQLEPAELAFGVKQRRPKTINEAVSSTIELESYLTKPNTRRNSSSVSHVLTDEKPVVESIQAVQRDLVGTMQKLAEKLELDDLSVDTSPLGVEEDRHGTPMPLLSAGNVTSLDTIPGDVLQMSTNEDLQLEELGPMED